MTSWSHGYVADAPYTMSYHATQTPAHIALATAMAGFAWRPREDMTVVDIGCGRGLVVNTLAAANPGWQCLGIDYNPAHIAEAAELATNAALDNAGFMEADLAEMTDAEIDRLPAMDVAMLHGVWSWVSDAVRKGIVRLLQRRLKPGGLLYIGYNALPGFAAEMATQRVIRQAASQQPHGDSIARAAAAVSTVRALRDSKAHHLTATPLLERMLDTKDPLDPSYLAHEFLTDHWRPVFFADLCADLAPAKLDFVGSVGLVENIPDLLFDPAQRAIWDATPDTIARELIKDVCLPRAFRRDIFIRGARRTDMNAALDQLVLGLTRSTPIPLKAAPTPRGAAELAPDMAEPIMQALSQGPCRLGDLRRIPTGRQPNAVELLLLLDSSGACLPLWREPVATARAARFNHALAQGYAGGGLGPARYALAAPGIGAGLPCSALELALATEPDIAGPNPPDAVTLSHRLLPQLNESDREQVINTIAGTITERLPVWRRFGIIS